MNLSLKKIVAIVSILGVAGAGTAYSMGVIAKPSAGIIDRGDWVNGQEVEVESTAYLHNPNPLKVNLSQFSASYNLEMNNVKLASGSKEGLYIPKNENRTLEFRTGLKTENIPAWWVSHLRNGERSELEIPIDASLKLGPVPISYGGYSYTDTINTDIEAALSSALSEMEGNYSRSLGPDVGLEANNFKIEVVDASARFGDVSRDTTELEIPMTLKNPNSYPVPTPQMGGNLMLNDVKLAEFTANNVHSASDTSIPPGGAREVTVIAEMSNQKIDEWFRSHVRKDEKTDAELNIYFEFDVEGASLRIPSEDGMTCSFDFATEILVDEKAETQGFQGCTGFYRGESSGSGQDGGDDSLLDEGLKNDSSGSDGSGNDTDQNSSSSDDGVGGLL